MKIQVSAKEVFFQRVQKTRNSSSKGLVLQIKMLNSRLKKETVVTELKNKKYRTGLQNSRTQHHKAIFPSSQPVTS